MEIRSLGKTDFDTIFESFNQAFADYEVQLDKEQLRAMLRRRGFDPGLSFAAFDGNRIVAFTLNGVGTFNGILTAYDTGTGTLKEYQGQGLATQVFEYSIPYLREKGIKQYLLEVLQHNTRAVSVYRNLGFEVSREFNYLICSNSEIRDGIKKTDTPYSIKQLDLDEFDPVSGFWDFVPSWQNSPEAIKRVPDAFICLGVFAEKELVGYCIFEPASGDITQIAVNKQHRRKGIASLLFSEMMKLNRNDSVKIINTDVLCDSITGFLKANNIDVTGKQFEMIKKI